MWLPVCQLVSEGTPALHRRTDRPPRSALLTGLPDMAGPAQGLHVLQAPRLAAPLKRHDVVDLQAARPPAGPAPPAVALQGGPPETAPAAPAQPVTVVVAAHRITGSRTPQRPPNARKRARGLLSGQGAARRYGERDHERDSRGDRQQDEIDADEPLGEIPRAG